MAQKADRDFDEILQGCRQIDDALKTLGMQINKLSQDAEEARSFLKDEIAAANIQKVEIAAQNALKALKTGLDRVRELESKTRADKARYEAMQER